MIGMLLTTATPAWGVDGDREAKGRNLLATFGPALVRVTATLKQQRAASGVQGRSDEHVAEDIGTVIDPAGIVVVPSVAFAWHVTAATIRVDGERKPIETQTEITKPVIHLADGTEVPARLALEDPDLSLLFVVPEKADRRQFRSVLLADGTAAANAAVQPLDEVFTLSRHGRVLAHEPTVGIARITALPTKPRRVYTLDDETGASCVTPVAASSVLRPT